MKHANVNQAYNMQHVNSSLHIECRKPALSPGPRKKGLGIIKTEWGNGRVWGKSSFPTKGR